ncbi:MAG: methyltransferase C-terminal protein [Actinomycetota bacterium]|nr:methyltransferase C-terminal protein [Actinomycetota bacterium]
MNEDPEPRCRGCGGSRTRLVADLGEQPASDDFPSTGAPGPDPRWPLRLFHCPDCLLVQLGPVATLPQEPVRAVESATSRHHAAMVACAVLSEHPALTTATVREFASHHGGSWLPALTALGCRQVDTGPASLVTDTHGLTHEPDLGEALATRVDALAPDGLLVIEHHHLLPLVVEGQFDTIRHGHFSYLSLFAIRALGRRHGLEVVSATAEPVFGGSLRTVLAPAGAGFPVHPSVDAVLAAEKEAGLHDGSGLVTFADRAHRSAKALRAYLTEQRAAGRRVLGYGAPSKAAILLGLAGVTEALLEFTVDAAPLKHGLAIPGVRVPIRPVSDLVAARPPLVLLLTWDIAAEVVSQLEADGGWGTGYVLPLPLPHLLTDPGDGATP